VQYQRRWKEIEFNKALSEVQAQLGGGAKMAVKWGAITCLHLGEPRAEGRTA